MRIDFAFSVGSAEDVSRIRIRQGQAFSLKVWNGTPESGMRWFADKDNVLDHDESDGTESVCIARSVGSTELLIMDRNANSVLKRVYIEVFSEEAATLGITAGEPQMK